MNSNKRDIASADDKCHICNSEKREDGMCLCAESWNSYASKNSKRTVAELPKEADGKETIKDYLENRIKGLYEADAAFCKDRWDMNLGPNERGLAREMSNQVTFARQELQEALKHL